MFGEIAPRTQTMMGGPSQVSGYMAGLIGPSWCGGRLSSSTSAIAADTSGASTIYLVPHASDKIILFDGTRQLERAFTAAGTALSVSGSTQSTTHYVYAYLSGDGVKIEYSLSIPVVNSTLQMRVKTGDPTRLYVGIFYGNATPNVTDLEGFRNICSYFHPVPYSDFLKDSSDNWASNGNGTWAAMNAGNAAWYHEFVSPVDYMPWTADISVFSANFFCASIGLNTATTPDRDTTTFSGTNSLAAGGIATSAMYAKLMTTGHHYLQAMQSSCTAPNANAYGDNGGFPAPANGSIAVNSGMRVNGWR